MNKDLRHENSIATLYISLKCFTSARFAIISAEAEVEGCDGDVAATTFVGTAVATAAVAAAASAIAAVAAAAAAAASLPPQHQEHVIHHFFWRAMLSVAPHAHTTFSDRYSTLLF